ncbi:hypothetical protein C8A05DRAFT_37117 [Staphylotrichum tortipilum]|uniref:Uncharacterized protein n=1 Tax=Staphylotrichum tortipilum TaxID=2831512 RepID=A0AAN6MEG0_9PEZI|nr:hypothetical protein C8A05DRAFT_37117 [Staphylotrichum longicolle]
MHHRLEPTWEFKKAGKRIDSFDEQYRATQEAGRASNTSYKDKQANHSTSHPDPQPTRRRYDPEKLQHELDKEREAKAAARRGRPYLRGQPQVFARGIRLPPTGPAASSPYSHLYKKESKGCWRNGRRLPKPPPLEEFHRSMCKRPKTPKQPPLDSFHKAMRKTPERSPQKQYKSPYKSPKQPRQPSPQQADTIQNPAGSRSPGKPTRETGSSEHGQAGEGMAVTEKPGSKTPVVEKRRAKMPSIEQPAEPSPPEAPKSPEGRAAAPQPRPNLTGSPKVKQEDTGTDHALLTGANIIPIPAPNLRAASESSHASSSTLTTSTLATSRSKSPAKTHTTEPSPNPPASRPTVDAAPGSEQPTPAPVDTAEQTPPGTWREDLKSLRGWFVDAMNGMTERVNQQMEEKHNELSIVVGRQGKMMEKYHALILSQLALAESIEADEVDAVPDRSRTSVEWQFIHAPIEGHSDDSADETYAPSVATWSVVRPPRGVGAGVKTANTAATDSESDADSATGPDTDTDSNSVSDPDSDIEKERARFRRLLKSKLYPPKHATGGTHKRKRAAAEEADDAPARADDVPASHLPPPHVLRVSAVPNPYLAKVHAMLREQEKGKGKGEGKSKKRRRVC